MTSGRFGGGGGGGMCPFCPPLDPGLNFCGIEDIKHFAILVSWGLPRESFYAISFKNMSQIRKI